MAETNASQKARQALQNYVVRRINTSDVIGILIAPPINAVNDPDSIGTAYSAQIAIAQLSGDASISDVMERMGIL